MVVNERDFFKHPFTRDEIRDLLKGRSAAEMSDLRSPSFNRPGPSGENPPIRGNHTDFARNYPASCHDTSVEGSRLPYTSRDVIVLGNGHYSLRVI